MNLSDAKTVLTAAFPPGSTVKTLARKGENGIELLDVHSSLTELSLNEPVAALANVPRVGRSLSIPGMEGNNGRMLVESLSWFLYGNTTSLKSEHVYR